MSRNKSKLWLILIFGSLFQCALTWLWEYYFPSNNICTATFLTIPLLIAGTAIGAYAMYQSGQAAKAQAETEAAIMEYNAKIKEQEEAARVQAAEYQAKAFEARGEKLQATQRALYGVSGVEMRGSPLSVLDETAAELEADRLQILREGYISAGQSAAEAQIYKMQGAAAKQRGSAAARGAVLSATGTVLSGLGTAGYYGYSMSSGGMSRNIRLVK